MKVSGRASRICVEKDKENLYKEFTAAFMDVRKIMDILQHEVHNKNWDQAVASVKAAKRSQSKLTGIASKAMTMIKIDYKKSENQRKRFSKARNAFKKSKTLNGDPEEVD